MNLYNLLQFSVCVFSILAAGFWLQSATLPNLTENLRRDGTGPLPDALKSQSRVERSRGGVCRYSRPFPIACRYAAVS